MKLLLQAGVDVNSGDGAESDNKILHWAASFANIDVIRILLGKNNAYSKSPHIRNRQNCSIMLYDAYMKSF